MNDQVEEIKSKVDIVAIIRQFVDLKKAGRNFKANCPFHEEKTPSFIVSPELQIYKCFGCGESGDVFTFLQKYEGMEFYEALKHLADIAKVRLKTTGGEKIGKNEKLVNLCSNTSRFYSHVLLNHKAGKKALSYLNESRGLKMGTIKKFSMGYSPNVQGPLVNFLTKKRKFSSQESIDSGIFYKRGANLIDRFKGRIIFPLFDHRGNTVGFAGRVMPGDKTEMGKYINSPETSVYHKSRVLFGLNLTKRDIKEKGYAIVVEGELDMISPWQAGFKNIVAIKGTALTEEQLKLLSRFTNKFVLALDSDAAGDLASVRGIEIAQKLGLEVGIADMGDYKDPDEMARKNPKLFAKAIKDSVNVWDYLIERMFLKFDVKSGSGKAKISKEVIPLLFSIKDRIVQAHYIEKVAEKLGVPTSAVINQISTIDKEAPKNIKENKDKEDVVKTRRESLESFLLTLIMQNEPGVLKEKSVGKIIKTPLYKNIYKKLRVFMKENAQFDPSEFSEKLPKELFDGFSKIILADTEDKLLSSEKSKKQIEIVINELKTLEVKEKLLEITLDIKKHEDAREAKKLKESQTEFVKLTQELADLEEIKDTGIILK